MYRLPFPNMYMFGITNMTIISNANTLNKPIVIMLLKVMCKFGDFRKGTATPSG